MMEEIEGTVWDACTTMLLRKRLWLESRSRNGLVFLS